MKIIGTHEPNTLAQMWRCYGVGPVYGAALCADGHLGYAQPVGAAIAYRDGYVSISGVGYDIACGNLAIKLERTPDDLRKRGLEDIGTQIKKEVSFGVGRTNGRKVDNPVFDMDDLWKKADALHLKDMAYAQIGTVGSGNHYVDLFEDEVSGKVWIGIHFGSRGLGHKLATKYLKAAGGRDGVDVPPTLVQEGTELGDRYLAAMTLAGLYAYAGREFVGLWVRNMLGARELDKVHNHHNFAWKEEHGGEKLWVVRKGCTPAFPGQRGFVGGSMGDISVILRGVDSPESKELLYSTVHGAGRVMGRAAAKRTFTQKEMDDWLKAQGVVLRGGDLDESPMAYRRLPQVLGEHLGTIEIETMLKPMVVCMAGRGDGRDPYKD